MTADFWGKAPIAIAHRGGDGAGQGQENTLMAFAAASKLGYQHGETDVILSADGQIVAIHGASHLGDTLLKNKPSRRSLQKKTYSQIQSEAGEGKIATLEELLKAQPNMRFFIDPKTEEVVLPLAKLLRGSSALNRVCLGSFNYQRVRRLQKLLEGDKVAFSLIIGRGIRIRNKNLQKLKKGSVKGVEAIQLHHSLVSRPMINLVHSQGFKAIVWTANSKLSIENAIKCGADGIISDRVSLLKSIIDR